ncbi:TIGR04388 family protein, partial [Leptospira neocaledonica]
DKYVAQEKKRAQDNAIAQASGASTMVSIAQTILSGGSGMDWAKQQVKEMTKSAVSTAVSKATGIPPDVISAYFDYKADKKAKQKAQQEMDLRLAVVCLPCAIMNQIPGIRDITKPIGSVLVKGVSEVIVGASSLLAESVHYTATVLGGDLSNIGMVKAINNTLLTDKVLNSLDDSIKAQGKEAAEYSRGKDLQSDLAKGDLKGQYKQALKEEIYLQIATAIAPSFGNMDPEMLSQLWQEFDRRQAAKEARKEQDQQALSTALSMATAIALQFIPGPGTAA